MQMPCSEHVSCSPATRSSIKISNNSVDSPLAYSRTQGKASDRSPFTLTCEVDLTARSRRTRHNFPSTPSLATCGQPIPPDRIIRFAHVQRTHSFVGLASLLEGREHEQVVCAGSLLLNAA
jgi:hypothetical protein